MNLSLKTYNGFMTANVKTNQCILKNAGLFQPKCWVKNAIKQITVESKSWNL